MAITMVILKALSDRLIKCELEINNYNFEKLLFSNCKFKFFLGIKTISDYFNCVFAYCSVKAHVCSFIFRKIDLREDFHIHEFCDLHYKIYRSRHLKTSICNKNIFFTPTLFLRKKSANLDYLRCFPPPCYSQRYVQPLVLVVA